MGRPTSFSQKVLDEICDRLTQGEPMAAICRDDKMPAARTVRDWIAKDEAVSAAIACAREVGFDAIAVEGLKIVDDTTEDPASRRVRADYRLRLLAKWDPKRYGEKVDLTHASPGGGPVELKVTFA